jgi:PAS domain S-box-containing protein
MRQSHRSDFEELAESIPHIVFLAAPDGSTDYFNHHGTDYTGLPAQANYGWGWLHRLPPADAARAQAAWAEATQSITPYEMQFRIRRHDGEFRWHDVRALPVRGGDGEVARWIGTATDIDAAVRLANRLRRIDVEATDALALLATWQPPSSGFGFAERVIRTIRVNAILTNDADHNGGRPGRHPPLDLSEGEQDVVRLIALGYTNKETAHVLAVSLRTVETRRRRALQKLGLTTRAQLVRFAFSSGLAEWD